MEATVEESEKLYRGVKRNKPNMLDEDGNISSALFKDDCGVSVDRDGKREEKIIFDAMYSKLVDKSGKSRLNAVVRINAGDCIKKELFVRSEPSENDQYHAAIYENGQLEPISNLNAAYLASKAELVDDRRDEVMLRN